MSHMMDIFFPMTIQEEIVRIQTAKSDIQQAITAKGVEVDDSDSISTYSDKINAINIVGEKGEPGDSARAGRVRRD